MKNWKGQPSIAIIGVTHRRDTQSFGGAPVVAVNLANHFVQRRLPVEAVLFARPDVTTFPFPFHSAVAIRRLNAASNGTLLAGIVLTLLADQPSHVIAIGNKANALLASAVGLPGIRSALWATLHHSLAAEIAGWTGSRRARRLRRWQRIHDRAAGVFTVSAGLAHEFARLVGIPTSKLHVVHNPIVDDALAERIAAPAVHPWLADPQPALILGVGRLTAQKDFATLIRAFARVRAQRPCRLLIIGEGEQRAQLVNLVAQLDLSMCVDLAGFHSNPFPFMRRARLLALSSRWEGFGNVLVEALLCGTPVVSTDCPHGPREILAAGRFGRLVPVGDPLALADAISATLDEPAQPARLSARAREFSVEASGDRYLETMGLGGSSFAKAAP